VGTRQGIIKKLLAAAFFMDAGFFLVLAAIPYKVLHLGGGPIALGLIPAVSSLSYVILAITMGRFSDRIGRYRMTRYGNLAFIGFCALAFQAPSLPRLALVMPLLGLGAALFWPVAQAAIGDLSRSRGLLELNTGRFNVAWCTGKAIGYFTGGMLLAHYDFKTTFLVGIGFAALSMLSLPRKDKIPDDVKESHRSPEAEGVDVEAAALPDAEAVVPESVRVSFRRMAWLANFAVVGAAGVLNHQLPKWYEDLGWRESRFGIFLGATFIIQAIMFKLLSGRVRLTYSVRRLILPQIVAGLAVLAIPFATHFAFALLLTPLMGVCLAVCYYASIFYSLHSEAGRGRNAGIHESLIGAASLTLPLLGGIGIRLSGWIGAPYLLSGLVILAAVAVQYMWWRRSTAGHASAPADF
jgi:MFS family permease